MPTWYGYGIAPPIAELSRGVYEQKRLERWNALPRRVRLKIRVLTASRRIFPWRISIRRWDDACCEDC